MLKASFWIGAVLALIYALGFKGFYYGFEVIATCSIGIYIFVVSYLKLNKHTRLDNSASKYTGLLKEALRDLKEAKPMIDQLKVRSDEWLHLSLDEQYDYIQTLKGYDFKVSDLSEAYQKMIKGLVYHPDEENDVLKILETALKRKHDHLNTALSYVVRDDKVEPYYALDRAYQQAFEQVFGESQTGTYALIEKIKGMEKENSDIIWRISRGVEGEKSVVRAITSRLPEEHLLESVRIEHNNQSAESDIIIVSPTGLYTLEVKNEGSAGTWNIRISPDGQWQKVYQNGNREAMKDHGGQMNHHIAVQERFLNEKLKERYGSDAPHIPMRGAIVIANDNVIVDNESDLVILRKSSIHRHIGKGTDQIEPIWQERIKGIFEEYSLPGKKYKLANIQAMTENLILETVEIASLHKLRYQWLQDWATSSGVSLPWNEMHHYGQVASEPLLPKLSIKEVAASVD